MHVCVCVHVRVRACPHTRTSGTLAALMRMRAPWLVHAAWASSTPLLGFVGEQPRVDQYAWRAQVTANWRDLGSTACVDRVREGFAALAASNAELGRDLDTAQESLATLQRAYDDLASMPRGPDPEVQEKLQISELKLAAVMETMEQNAKDAQKEISQLKVKLFEYEMGDVGSMADDLSSVMGGMSRNTSLGSLPSLAR